MYLDEADDDDIWRTVLLESLVLVFIPVSPIDDVDGDVTAKKDTICFDGRKASVWWKIDKNVTREDSKSRSRRSVVGEDRAIMTM